MFKKLLVTFLVVVFLGSAYLGSSYRSWKNNTLQRLHAESSVVETAVGDVEYRLWGDQGPVMLWLHGTRGSYAQYTPNKRSNIPPMRVLAVSRPGYLRTPLDTGKTPEQQATAYAALLDVLNIDSVIVMGVSGGGPSALSFASEYPNRTMALILAEAVSQPIDYEDSGASASILTSLMDTDFFSWLLNSMFLSNPESIVTMLVPDPNNQRKLLEDPYKIKRLKQTIETTALPSIFLSGVSNDGLQTKNLNLNFEAINSPTLIIHGTADSAVPIDQSKKLSQQLRNAEFVQIEAADHFMMHSHMEEVDAAIVSFLQTNGVE